MARAEWKPDSECPSCEGCFTTFGLFRRRHHCRRCGGIFCDKCSSEKWKGLPGYSTEGPQRVCKNCKFDLEAILEVGKMRPRERKVCVVGCSGVGKTSLLLLLCASRASGGGVIHGMLDTTSAGSANPRAGVSSPVPYRGSVYVLHFMDVAAQGAYDAFQPQLTIGAHAYLFVFDVMNRASFLGLTAIRNDVLRCGGRRRVTFLVGNRKLTDEQNSSSAAPIAGAGNSIAATLLAAATPLYHQNTMSLFSDGASKDHQVRSEEAQKLAEEWDAHYVELSGRRQRSDDELLLRIVRRIAEWDDR